LHVSLYALPNILAGRKIVPELIQSKAAPEQLGVAVEAYLTHRAKVRALRAVLSGIHHSLRRNANKRAAEAIIKMLKSRKPFSRRTSLGTAS
jgi:lipid-A-disaccharide synthase